MVVMPSAPTSTNAPNGYSPFVAPCARRDKTNPADAKDVIFMKSRRFTLTTFMSHLLGRAMDRTSDAHVCPASAEIAAHGLVDLRVGRLLRLLQKRRGAHDLARLAISALRDVLREPCLLKRMRSVGRKALDCGDLFPGDGLQRRAAGANRLAVREHRARAAEAAAAPEFGAGHPDLVPQNPQERRVGR